ncbi:MAG: hypothetical protein CFE41_21405 [Burkholderiales bacterium PBB2]|nr:MAG: hypothetical protein CFE41_21405 [Burkholderiales bacterium PBB2]
MIDAELFVVSAGLGLVSGDENVPAYDLTISAGAGSIAPTLRRLGVTDQAWWQALTAARDQGHPLSGLVGNDHIEQVWIAMPSTYLSMVATELSAVDAGVARRKLRIFSSSKSHEVLPEHLRPCLMPYDTRLEAAGFAGTTSDFPQRCLLHFAKALSGRGTSLDEARSRVLAALEGLNAPTKPERQKLDDAEIIHVLRQQWQQHRGSSTKLLRYLRDGAGIACEQGRFRQLWLGLKQEQQANALRS